MSPCLQIAAALNWSVPAQLQAPSQQDCSSSVGFTPEHPSRLHPRQEPRSSWQQAACPVQLELARSASLRDHCWMSIQVKTYLQISHQRGCAVVALGAAVTLQLEEVHPFDLSFQFFCCISLQVPRSFLTTKSFSCQHGGSRCVMPLLWILALDCKLQQFLSNLLYARSQIKLPSTVGHLLPRVGTIMLHVCRLQKKR